MRPIDVLVVGAGPAGLATAIRLRQRLATSGDEAAVVVIDKAPESGYHNLSGAVLEPACLDELLPGWQQLRNPFTESLSSIERDEMYFLRGRTAHRIPTAVVPKAMRHRGDVAISLSRLVAFLAREAERMGVEVYRGYSARSLVVENGAVRGVLLTDVGLDRDGGRQPNYRPGEEIRATLTVIADGSHGVLSTQFAQLVGRGENPQVYSLGIKAVVQFPRENAFGANRAVHTLGFPTTGTTFGGGFIYSLGEKLASVGSSSASTGAAATSTPARVRGLPRPPFIARLLADSVTIATGARTIPEGGYYALGRLSADGALLVGDAAGFVNMEKIKGIHYAVEAGMCAADTIADALAAGDVRDAALSSYRRRLDERGILRELYHARNYRQSFRWGIYPGAPLSLVQSRLPFRLGMNEDHRGTKRGARLGRSDPGRMDGATFVGLTGSRHREDEPSHVTIIDPSLCLACGEAFAHACTSFCPGQVYRWNQDRIVLSPSNCLHCMTCTVKCPAQNISWLPPEGGEGPRFKQM
jgi:electron-transferring-flavoprotein dehydrogenase